jgi:hypothetical protein
VTVRTPQCLLLSAAALASVMAGCGGHMSHPRAPARPRGLARTPAALLAACVREHLTCPRLWPIRLDRRPMTTRSVRTMEPGILLDVSNGFCGRRQCQGIFHADIGQQSSPFPPVSERLRFPTRTHTIPVQGGGRFVQQRAPRRLTTTTIHGAQAAVYQAAAYPQGGLSQAGFDGDLVSRIVSWRKGILRSDGTPEEVPR